MLISPCKKWLLIDQEYKVLNLAHCSFYELLLIYFPASVARDFATFFSPNRCATVRINFFQSCEKVKLPFYSVTLNMQKSFHRWLLFLLLALSLLFLFHRDKSWMWSQWSFAYISYYICRGTWNAAQFRGFCLAYRMPLGLIPSSTLNKCGRLACHPST